MNREQQQPMSVAAYARRRGMSHKAVQKAIEDGRIERALVIVGGKPKIADAALADREWRENTRPRIDHAELYEERAPGPQELVMRRLAMGALCWGALTDPALDGAAAREVAAAALAARAKGFLGMQDVSEAIDNELAWALGAIERNEREDDDGDE